MHWLLGLCELVTYKRLEPQYSMGFDGFWAFIDFWNIFLASVRSWVLGQRLKFYKIRA